MQSTSDTCMFMMKYDDIDLHNTAITCTSYLNYGYKLFQSKLYTCDFYILERQLQLEGQITQVLTWYIILEK